MEKGNLFLTGVLALALTLGLFLAGCSNPAGPENNNPENNNNGNNNNDNDSSLVTQNLVLKGTYPSPKTGGTAKFQAATSGESGKSVRAVSENDFVLSGELEDGDILLRLKGFYNSDTRTFILSAASETFGIKVQISGSYAADNTISAAKAVVQVKNGDEWVANEITIVKAADVAITGKKNRAYQSCQR
ncbi:hypothetical protein AGMMS50268_14350 [Spirochaetia bacterium]|nr:hypothetical protein AGMMS50268_14350 [Spirochaetia bacterium]